VKRSGRRPIRSDYQLDRPRLPRPVEFLGLASFLRTYSPATIAIPRAVSSVGRAPARQAGGHWFEPSTAHLITKPFQTRSGHPERPSLRRCKQKCQLEADELTAAGMELDPEQRWRLARPELATAA